MHGLRYFFALTGLVATVGMSSVLFAQSDFDFPAPDGGPDIPIVVSSGFGYLTLADIVDGERIIRVDPSLLANTPLSRFALTHEYGHHRLGHLSSPVPKPSKDQEADASCWAVGILAIAGDEEAIDFGIAHLARQIEDEDDRRRLSEISACRDFVS